MEKSKESGSAKQKRKSEPKKEIIAERSSSNGGKPAVTVNEIDDMFADAIEKKKTRKNETSKKEKVAKKSSQSSSLVHEHVYDSSSFKNNNQNASKYAIISPDAPLERIDTESGLPVYKAHLLKVGEGGGTDLCPFDCDCCF